jgi:putative aminopeptidase FrvX
MKNLMPLLEELCNAFGPPGNEDEVREIIRNYMEPLADEVTTSVLGNLIAVKKAKDSDKTVMLDAHTDEVGFLISHIDDNGFLRFAGLGGWDSRVLPAHRMTVGADDGKEYTGVIGVLPPHVTKDEDRGRAFDIKELFLDIGCASREAVERLGISVGSTAVIHYPFMELQDGCITSKALDNRVGCALIMAAFEALKDSDLPFNLVASFSVQEEVGLRGARSSAEIVRPDVALALEGTTATDTPGVAPEQIVCSLRKGPAITVADRSLIVPQRMVNKLKKWAEADNIPYQVKMPIYGGTDAGAIHLSGAGVLTGVLSVPCRYIHSSASVLSRDDLEHTFKLLLKFIEFSPDLFTN